MRATGHILIAVAKVVLAVRGEISKPNIQVGVFISISEV